MRITIHFSRDSVVMLFVISGDELDIYMDLYKVRDLQFHKNGF